MVTTTRKLTYQDYAKTPDDERYELLDGELVFMPSPKEIHQRLLLKLGLLLYAFVMENSSGSVYVAPFDVVLSDTNTLQPDILVHLQRALPHNHRSQRTGRARLGNRNNLHNPTRTETRLRKREIYERHGVGEYWLVDPDARNVTALTLRDGAYRTAGIYGESDTLTSPTLRGFTLDLAELL